MNTSSDPISAELKQIESLIQSVKMQEAEDRCRSLINNLGRDELQFRSSDIRSTIGCFFKERKRALLAELERTLASSVLDPEGEIGPSDITPELVISDFASIEARLRDGLEDLSDRHIFQWSTFYRDFFVPMFSDLCAAARAANGDDLVDAVRREVAVHAHDVFKKGYQFTAYSPNGTHAYAITKSETGLQRFVELPIEIYSSAISREAVAEAATIRKVCSAIVLGIIEGYGHVAFGHDSGWKLLPRFPRAWAHYLGFLTAAHVDRLLTQLEPGVFREGVSASLTPVSTVLDHLAEWRGDEYCALPSLGQFHWDYRRIDIALQSLSKNSSAKLIEIQCFIDGGFVTRRLLEEAVNRDVSLVAAPLRADVQDWVESHDLLRSIVVNTSSNPPHRATQIQRAEDILRQSLARETALEAFNAPLVYNFARDFPLNSPFLTRYFHVYRSSVRDLLRKFEHRNGVRLWCSVRRSGKTTACFDLSATTGTSTVVSQTCDNTADRPDASTFYELVIEALDQGQQLPNAFFQDAVERCSTGRRESDFRYVFVLDEYETLFERLRLATAKNRELRYTVVQPLLNQMVAFSRDNLLVFIGQRPDAHFILMDQNQLSPYVQQDSFPLFTYYPEEDKTEFRELLKKVLTDRIRFDTSFERAVYGETAGHPFLTVQVLIALFDWLIARRQPVHAVLKDRDFEEFRREKLTKQVGQSNLT